MCVGGGVWWAGFVCCGNVLCPVAVMSTSFGCVCSCTKIPGEAQLAVTKETLFGLLSGN